MHDVVDQISLEIARRVADRLRRDPSLIEIARENLKRWDKRNANSASLLRCSREWEAILRQPIDRVCAILCAETDEGQRLRQNAPFPGVLPRQEVSEIKKAFRKSDAPSS